MSTELTGERVGARLRALRAAYVPETVEEARERLAREVPVAIESFASKAARCLAELRALDELARHLSGVATRIRR